MDKFDTKVVSTRTVRLPCGCTEIESFNAAHERIRSSDDELCREHERERYLEGVAEARAEARYERTGRRY